MREMPIKWPTKLISLTIVIFAISCGSGRTHKSVDASVEDVCNCSPTKNKPPVPLPEGTPEEVSVGDILSWGTDASSATQHNGKLHHISGAFLQSIRIVSFDCDILAELSATPDPDAPRMVVEVPQAPDFCPNRQQIQQRLKASGLPLNTSTTILKPALPVDVTGLGFLDCETCHDGLPGIATRWEIHPALLTL